MARWLIHILSIGLVLLASGGAFAEESYFDKTFFNRYILEAYKRMMNYTEAKYDLHSNFTKRLNYGSAVIEPVTPGATMCNGAVTQAILEAIDIYAAEPKNSNWSPEKYIPAESWTKSDWAMLKPHLFSESYFEYPPLEKLPSNVYKLWDGLGSVGIQDSHSGLAVIQAWDGPIRFD